MVKQKKNYIAEKKKKHLIKAGMWGCIIFVIMVTGILLLDTRASYFTVVAAVLVLPLALHITRFVAFVKYQDPSIDQAERLEQIKGNYVLYHSAIIADPLGTFYFEHIIVTAKNIYFITKDQQVIEKAKPILAVKLENKGVSAKSLHFIHVSQGKTIEKIACKIEKEANQVDEVLETTIKIIDGMLM